MRSSPEKMPIIEFDGQRLIRKKILVMQQEDRRNHL